jgi:hypothetical protein
MAPYLECSSKGDKRFSAFYAKLGDKTIEELYQSFKILEDGRTGLSIKEAKGKKAVNQKEASRYYLDLWISYMMGHPELHSVLIEATGLSDIFGQPKHECQATVLWHIRTELIRANIVKELFNHEE